MRTPFWLLLPTLLLFSMQGLGAQEREVEKRVLTGRVIDATTGAPLVGAFVHLDGENRGVLTDAEGRFGLPGVFNGMNTVGVEQLGYVDYVETLALPEEAGPVLFALEPDPILLEGIQIVTDRFERRRMALAIPSQAFEREDLIDASSFNVLDFVRTRSFLWTVRCNPSFMDSTCAYYRGRLQPVSVYLDEMPFIGGIDLLTTMHPQELHRIEVYRGGTHIRLYTEQFMKRAGRTRLTPLAILR